MAYVLGFFAADGNMIKNARGGHFIEFQITDRDLLYTIRDILESTHVVTARQRNVDWKTIYRLQIGSKVMFRDLIALGMTPSKSHDIRFPLIKKDFLPDFIRGYFDGDGTVVISRYERGARKGTLSSTILSGFVSGSKFFLTELHAILKMSVGIMGGSLYFSNRGYRLAFSVQDSLRLYHFMYGRANSPFLSRKKEIFENYFKLG